jgi:hypothetical protein
LLIKTLAEIRTALLVRAGMNTSGTSVDLTPTVLNGIVNDAIYEAWDVLTQKWTDYRTALEDVTVVAGTDTYALPSDFYKARVVWIADGTRYLRLYPASLDDAHKYTGASVGTKGDYRYRLTNGSLVLMPVPAAAEAVRVFYIPSAQELANDDDELRLDVPIELKYILALGWRDILDRQNLDPSPAIAKIEKYEAKLRTAADGLDSRPFYLGDYSDEDDDWPEVPN